MSNVNVATAAFLVAISAGTAHAGLNDPACQPTADRPPVILVHGRGGDVGGFGPLVFALEAAGHCVYGTNYGRTNNTGPNGHDHLSTSGAQIAAYIDRVLADTGARQVDVIGHSAGTGVLANVVHEKRKGDRIRRFISFGGLHHPYAHAGLSGLVDGQLFLPNLIATARLIDPDITAQQVIVSAIDLYAGAGGSLAGIDAETATSNFAADLFEPAYWSALHGRLSEAPGIHVTVGNGNRSIGTSDSIPTICYTNIVGLGDLITGAAAGVQDPAPNFDNFLQLTTSDPVQILSDLAALTQTLDALARPCASAVPPDRPGDAPSDPDDPSGAGDAVGGCSATDTAATGASIASCLLAALAALGLAAVTRRRRR
jgi:MYXO-CTERM domain-containing protein